MEKGIKGIFKKIGKEFNFKSKKRSQERLNPALKKPLRTKGPPKIKS